MKKLVTSLCLLVLCCAGIIATNGNQLDPNRVERDQGKSLKKTEVVMSPAAAPKSNLRKASSETHDVFSTSSLGLSNAESVDDRTFRSEKILFTFGKGTGTVDPKYYDLGNAIRMYGGNILLIESNSPDVRITDIEFTFQSGYEFTAVPEVSNGQFDFSSQSWSGAASAVEFTIPNTCRIPAITVYYTLVSGDLGNYYFVGTFNDWAIDTPEAKMTKNGSEYEIKNVSLYGSGEFKIGASGWLDSWGWGIESNDSGIINEYNLSAKLTRETTAGACVNMYYELDGHYDVYFNPSNSVVRFEKISESTDKPDDDPILEILDFGYDLSSKTAVITGPRSSSTIINNLEIPEYVNRFGEKFKITEIAGFAFQNNYNIKGKIVFGKGISYINMNAFAGCPGITSVDFSKCQDLTTLEIGQFRNCTGLQEIVFGSNSGITSLGALSYPAMQSGPFSGCSALKKMDLENCKKLKLIGWAAFQGCSSLTAIPAFPASLTNIAAQAFQDCKNLTGELILGGNIQTIGALAFENCSNIQKITIGENVKEIGAVPNGVDVSRPFNGETFNYCNSVATVNVLAVNPPKMTGNDNFVERTYSTATLIVPDNSLASYKAASQWSKFAKIVTQSNQEGGEDEKEVFTYPVFNYNASEWTYLGDAEFKDAWFNVMWSTGSAQPYQVPVYQNKANHDIFLLMNPYGPDTPYNGVNISSKEGYIYIDATDPTCVVIRPATYSCRIYDKDYYTFNMEGFYHDYYNLPLSEIKNTLKEISTYSPATGLISIKNGCLLYDPVYVKGEGPYFWNFGEDQGYIQLPGFGGSGSNPMVDEITITYCANGVENLKKTLKPNDNGEFEIEIDNLDWFWFTDNSTSTSFGVDLFESSLGMNLPTVNYLETGKPYAYTPWRGNYKIIVSGDLSMVTVSTSTQKPSTIDLYLTGEYNDWAFTADNMLEQSGNNTFTYTVPSDIEGGWKIGSRLWQYDYSYTGAVNPYETYQMLYNLPNNTTIPLYKGDELEITINRDLYYKPATLNINRAKTETPEPPAGESTMEVNGVTYTMYPDLGYFIASDGANAAGDVNLIATTGDLKLKGIAANAFLDNGLILSVTIPDGVTEIGDDAFRNCINLQKINLPSSLTTIGKYAFLNCSYLSTFSLPASIKSIGIGAFQDCTDLETFYFNETKITEIPDALFEGCSRLKEVNIPASVVKVGANSFMASGVVKIGVTTNVSSVGDRAFEDSQLAQFDFNRCVEIGTGAFKGTKIKSAELAMNLKTIGSEAFANCKNLAKVTLPPTLQSIGRSTFEECSSLSTIDIPASVTAIWEKAFYNSGLVTIVVGDNVTQLGANSLVTNSLTSITLGSGINNLENTPLQTSGMLRINNVNPPALGNDRLGKVVPEVVIVPNGAGAAYNATRWKEFTILEEGNEKTIYLSASGSLVSDVGSQLNLRPAEITSLRIVTNAENGTLNESDWSTIKSNMTHLIKLDISRADVKALPDSCFKGKKILTQIVLPQNLQKISDSAFENCKLLSSVKIPETVTEIGKRAFFGCYSMDGNIVIPSDCQTLGEEAFKDCYAIENLMINSVLLSEIEDSAFENCRSLDSVSLPEGLTSIGEKAFAEAGITQISVPNSLEEIGAGAFEGCFYLSSIKLPAAVAAIGARAFAKSGLVAINLPSSLTVLEDETFDSCDDLLCVNLSASIKTVGDRAIASPSVSSISSMAQKAPAMGYEPFEGIDNYTCTLSIPAFSFNDYISAPYWGSFVGIHNNIEVEISGTADVTYIDETDYQSLLRSVSGKAIKGKLAKKYAAASAIESGNFARVFDNAQMCVPEDVSLRFFFNGNLNDYTVEYNGANITSEIDPNTNSWVAPLMTGSSRLKITSRFTGVDGIGENYRSNGNVYDLYGRLLIMNASDAQIQDLVPGFYIIDGKKVLIGKNK